jgi:hypothetical protein
VQNPCSVTLYQNNYDVVFVPLTGKYMAPLEAQHDAQRLSKANVLQYKKNSSNLSRSQKYSQISKGYWVNRRKCYATQSQIYTNPNTSSLKRVNYVAFPYPNDIVGQPNNPSGPYRANVPNPFGCPSNTLIDGGNLLCNTIVNPCTDEVIEKTFTQNCYPTTDSDVPGPVTYLCWNDGIQTWYPKQRYIMTNSLDKWPVNYKAFVSAETPCIPYK